MRRQTFRLGALAAPFAVLVAACSSSSGVVRTGESAGDPVGEARTMTRDSAIALMKRLEELPLGATAIGDRTRAFEWITTSDELRGALAIDGRYLKPLEESDYPFAGELLMQFAFGMALHRLQSAGEAGDYPAQVEAGLRSVITTYRNIVQADRKLTEKFLEDLDQIRRLGRLRDYIAKVDEQSR